jgi:hypothetical protein
VIKSQKPSPAEVPFLFEIDPQPLSEALTAWGGVPLVIQALRSQGVPKSVQRHVHLKQRERGYDEATMVENFVVLNAPGRDCLVDSTPYSQSPRGKVAETWACARATGSLALLTTGKAPARTGRRADSGFRFSALQVFLSLSPDDSGPADSAAPASPAGPATSLRKAAPAAPAPATGQASEQRAPRREPRLPLQHSALCAGKRESWIHPS